MSRQKPRFRDSNPYAVPPGGVWFFQVGDDRVATPSYEHALRQVAAVLAKHGMDDLNPVDELAKFMCPHMPAWFCVGSDEHSPVITGRAAAEKALPFFRKPLVTSDVITRRMERCQACPKHRRDFCLHCTGYDTWIIDNFGGRRPKLPVDEASGCCSCAGTMEAVIASVDYAKDEPGFEGAPDTCWRNDR